MAVVVDRFVPPELRESPEAVRRARFAVALAWVSTGLFVLAIPVQGPRNSRAILVMNILSALLCAAAPFVLRRIGRPTLICNCVLALSFVEYVVIAMAIRGPGLSGATILLAQIPLVATFLMGMRVGAVWLVLSTLAGFGIGLLGRAGLIVDHLPPEQRLFNDHFILVVSAVLLFSIAWLYERTKDAAQHHIYELEALRRAAELDKVQATSRSQLAEARRLASLGRIAAATAHEINSPLAAVVANLQLAAEQLSPAMPPELAVAIRTATESAQRIGTIVADMNEHAQPRGASTEISVPDAIATALKLAYPHTRARARVDQQIATPLPPVVAGADLTEVLLNLIVNAAEALPEGQANANVIVVAARASGQHVIVEVSRSTDITSYGLAVCEGIVEKLGGTLKLGDRDGTPVVRITLAAATPPTTSAAVQLAILVVDDDNAILVTLKRLLSPHRITVANDGREALAVLTANSSFDLILCDLMMPDLTGMDLYEQLPDRKLAERCVFMTGGTFTERADKFRRSIPSQFIEKPFNVADVRRIVREHADRVASAMAVSQAAGG